MKYILSNKDTYDPYEGQNKIKASKKIIIPSKFTAHDKIHRYGGRIEDPFKVNTQYKDELKQRVFTSSSHQKNPQKKLQAVEQINNTFKKARDIKVGMSKPGSGGKVTAAQVLDIFPSFQAMPHKILHVINDDQAVLEENLPLDLDANQNQ